MNLPQGIRVLGHKGSNVRRLRVATLMAGARVRWVQRQPRMQECQALYGSMLSRIPVRDILALLAIRMSIAFDLPVQHKMSAALGLFVLVLEEDIRAQRRRDPTFII